MAITLKNIAEICVVDVSTVSRALRNDPRVREQTRILICKKAAELGYNPNLAARQLVSGRTLNLWMIIPDLKQSIVQEPAQYLSESLNRQGYDLLVTLYQNDAKTFSHLLNRLSQNVADGAFIIPSVDYELTPYESLIKNRFPLVFIDRKPDFNECTTVTTANADASATLVKQCIKAGAEQFVILFDENNSAAAARFKGAVDILTCEDIPFIAESSKMSEDFIRTGKTAVIASSSTIIENFYDNNSSVMHLSETIAGVFDYWFGLSERYSHIFVCKQDFRAIADQAAELMLRKIAGSSEIFLTKEIKAEQIITVKAISKR
jgi:LacI family transcriptional regulator, galactose operon repressor